MLKRNADIFIEKLLLIIFLKNDSFKPFPGKETLGSIREPSVLIFTEREKY